MKVLTAEGDVQTPRCALCRERPVEVHGHCRRCELREQRGPSGRGRGPAAARYLRYTGQPCLCGCGRPARGRSGLSRTCYNRGFFRQRAWQTVMRRGLGIAMDVRQVLAGLAVLEAPISEPQAQEALRACRILMVEIAQGRLALMRNPWGTRR